MRAVPKKLLEPLGAGAAVLASRLFAVVTTTIQLPILTRLLGQEQYGSLSVAIAVSSYFALVVSDPQILPFQRQPGTFTDQKNYRYALTIIIFSSLVLGLIGLLPALYFGAVERWVSVVGWGFGLAASRLSASAWLAWLHEWRYSINLMISSGARTAVLVTLVWVGMGPLLAVGVAGCVAGILALVAGPRLNRSLARPSQAPWTRVYGVRLTVASLAINLQTSAALLILPLFVPLSTVGKFAAMTQIASYTIGTVLNLINTVAYPRLRRLWDLGRETFVRDLRLLLQSATFAIALLVLSAVLIGDAWLARVLVGADFTDTALLPPLVFGTAFVSAGAVSNWLHQFRYDAKAIAGRTLLCTLATLALLFGFVPSLGSHGAAMGTVLGSFIYFLALGVGLSTDRVSQSTATIALVLAIVPLITSVSPNVSATLFASAGVLVSVNSLQRAFQLKRSMTQLAA